MSVLEHNYGEILANFFKYEGFFVVSIVIESRAEERGGGGRFGAVLATYFNHFLDSLKPFLITFSSV